MTAPSRRETTIAAVDVLGVAVPNQQPRRHSEGVTTHTVRTLVRLRTEGGLEGLGEVPARVPPETVRHLLRRCLGRTVWDLHRMRQAVCGGKFYVQDAHAAFAGLEMACLDVQARHLGVGVAELLGGAMRDQVATALYVYELDGNGAAPARATPDSIAEWVDEQCAAGGYRTVKVKGGVRDPAFDVAVLQAVRRVRPDVSLRLDPNANWTVATGVTVSRELATVGLQWLEDPTPGVDGMADVAQLGATPLATNMCLTHLGELPAAVRARAVQVLLPDLWYAGGLRAALSLTEAAATFGIASGVHSSGGELGVAMAAMLHLAAAMDVLPFAIDTHRVHLTGDIVNESLAVRDGSIAVPTGAGLGIHLNEEATRRYNEEYQRLALQTGTGRQRVSGYPQF